jgi:NAD(P)-dependent dehydrogenase (short-subunit alcohol dehydrogenase family)
MNYMKLFRLDGKTTLVTGCRQGLGKEIALGLAQNGASLILADIVYSEETFEEIVDMGSRCVAVKTDISTDLTKALRDSEKIYQGLIKKIPLKRFGKTSEVVGAVLFLSPNASSYMTGTIISVDGSYLAQ